MAAVPAVMSCNKFLDADPSKSTQKTLETAEQLDAILGTYSRFYSEYNHTALACDDFGISPEMEDGGASFSPVSELAFILCSDRCTQTGRLLWDGEYSKIYYANLVLANIDDVSGDQAYKDNLKAEAHFLRAYSMFQLALAYTLYYDGTNGGELGLTLKQTTSFEESVARANLADTWAFIDSDLQAALEGITAPLVSDGKRRVWRGTTAAVHAFAARYYLYRGDYTNRGFFALAAFAASLGGSLFRLLFLSLSGLAHDFRKLFVIIFFRSHRNVHHCRALARSGKDTVAYPARYELQVGKIGEHLVCRGVSVGLIFIGRFHDYLFQRRRDPRYEL